MKLDTSRHAFLGPTIGLHALRCKYAVCPSLPLGATRLSWNDRQVGLEMRRLGVYHQRMAPLAPGYLIASPPLGDPNFSRTVVLLVLHGPEGALGFVVNRQAPLKLGEVLGLAGYDSDPVANAAGDVLVGGPVEPGSGWILVRSPELLMGAEDILEVSADVGMSSSRAAFDALARDIEACDPAVNERMVFLGYSGWGPGQLEQEISQGSWLPAPFDASVLFDVELDARWEQAHALLGIVPAMGLGMRTVGDA